MASVDEADDVVHRDDEDEDEDEDNNNTNAEEEQGNEEEETNDDNNTNAEEEQGNEEEETNDDNNGNAEEEQGNEEEGTNEQNEAKEEDAEEQEAVPSESTPPTLDEPENIENPNVAGEEESEVLGEDDTPATKGEDGEEGSSPLDETQEIVFEEDATEKTSAEDTALAAQEGEESKSDQSPPTPTPDQTNQNDGTEEDEEAGGEPNQAATTEEDERKPPPVETQPVEAQLVEAQPVEAHPVEAQPGEPQAAYGAAGIMDPDDDWGSIEIPPAAAAAVEAIEQEEANQRPTVAREESVRDHRNRLEGTPSNSKPASRQESGPHFDVEDLDRNLEDNRGASLEDAAKFRGGDWEVQLSSNSNPWSDSSSVRSDGSMRKRKQLSKNGTQSTIALDPDEGSVVSDASPSFGLFGRGRRGASEETTPKGRGLFGFRFWNRSKAKTEPPDFPGSESDLESDRKTLDDESDEESGNGGLEHQKVYMNCNPWFPSLCVSIAFVVPCLVILMITVYSLTGRVWSLSAFAGHLLLTCLAGMAILRLYSGSIVPNSEMFDTCFKKTMFATTCLSSLADIVLFGCLYHDNFQDFLRSFLIESDGTTVPEYDHFVKLLDWAIVLGFLVVSSRLLFGTLFWTSFGIARMTDAKNPLRSYTRIGCLDWPVKRVKYMTRGIFVFLMLVSMVSLVCFGWALYDTVEYFIGWTGSVRQRPGPHCDVMDLSECMLPFPSYHYMIPSKTSQTGFLVNLQSDLLPPLKGRIGKMDAHFLNAMDGFSPAGPILFYVNGIKESQEAEKKHHDEGTRLMGPYETALSTTDKSMTLLLDVQARQLVAHSAEIDNFDSQRPLVLISPASPLKHGHQYAVAVFNATNMDTGKRLAPTFGMEKLLFNTTASGIEKEVPNPDTANGDVERRDRYLKKVLPALQQAAPWIPYGKDPRSLQLLFDFPTASESAQLGPIRRVRNTAMREIQDPSWNWTEHARVNKMKDFDCLADGVFIARVIEAEIDVPWFLEGYGQGQRGAFLDLDTIYRGMSVATGTAKFSIQIPCSVWAGIVQRKSDGFVKARGIKAVMEFGHGLFSDRSESKEEYVQKIADEGGYIVTAMDWRGMSKYDLPVMFKALVSASHLFQAIRDNLVQGYACKLAMQSFSRLGLWDTDWLAFEKGGTLMQPSNAEPPAYVFYGNSQGGTLGAGYLALSGPTKLIDRAVLGVAGTPFTSMLARQVELRGYDEHLLRNFQNNRHIQMLLAVLQMSLDCTEASGFLAEPVSRSFPPVLLQTALGDASVPAKATETLARGFQARLLPHKGREIFGLNETIQDKDVLSDGEVVLTEWNYRQDYHNLTLKRDRAYGIDTQVHECLRRDRMVNKQIFHFLGDGYISDICVKDLCLKNNAVCLDAQASTSPEAAQLRQMSLRGQTRKSNSSSPSRVLFSETLFEYVHSSGQY